MVTSMWGFIDLPKSDIDRERSIVDGSVDRTTKQNTDRKFSPQLLCIPVHSATRKEIQKTTTNQQ